MMGKIVCAQASTHAFTFLHPSEWDAFRAVIAGGFERRQGHKPEDNPGLATEDASLVPARYDIIRDNLDELRRELHATRPDALILIGDDQNENFLPDLVPQIAIYTGPDFEVRTRRRVGGRQYRSHCELAIAILENAVEDGYDVAMCAGLRDNALTSHAHYEILQEIVAESGIPVVLVFVNALTVPALSPSRCHGLGQSIRRTIDARPAGERIGIYASGGLSHFTGGFPWRHYDGPFAYGGISTEFDRDFMELIRNGEGARTAAFTSRELLHHGNVEMRSWITLLGAVGSVPTARAVYEPFFRGMMGMAVASWAV